MAEHHEILAFRHAETLTLGIYRVTDTWPRALGEELAGSLRLMTPAITDCILDGCSWSGPSATCAWRTAVRLLERLADGLDRADRLGLLDPESTLELLKAQSGALMEILLILDEIEDAGPAAFRETTSGLPAGTKTPEDLRRAA